MKKIKSEKGITLISLIMYIIITAIILAILSVISISFRKNLNNMDTATVKETEFDKLNIQLLKETKIEDNYIDTANSTDTKIVFTNGNAYTYVSEPDNAIYLNDYIKVAENIEECTYKYAEANDKLKLTVTVKINGIQRILEYTFVKDLSEEYSLWDGESSEPPVLIDANWYIYNAKQFKFLADYVNSAGVLTEEQENKVIKAGYNPESLKISDSTTVYLMRNLDLGARVGEGATVAEQWETEENKAKKWTPIGIDNDTHKFIGAFEGNGHTIRGAYVFVTGEFGGIFGNTTNTIQNLTVKDSYIKSSSGRTGGIIGVAREGGQILNCHNINTYVIGGNRHVGGIAGQSQATRITNCSNSGNIHSNGASDGYSYVGGIVGAAKNTVQDCINSGKITGDGQLTAGIVGMLNSSSTIENCTNYGLIMGANKHTGGICGQSARESQIIGCKNTGSITGTTFVGGITGSVIGTIEKCYNEGQITSENSYLGGIAGGMLNASIVTIQNTYNKGTIIAKNTFTGFAGGIAGGIETSGSSTVNISNNYNVGTITIEGTGSTDIGGAIGSIEALGTVTVNASKNYYLVEEIPENYTKTYETPKTDTEMRTDTFVTELNTGLETKAWKKTSTYPALIGM